MSSLALEHGRIVLTVDDHYSNGEVGPYGLKYTLDTDTGEIVPQERLCTIDETLLRPDGRLPIYRAWSKEHAHACKEFVDEATAVVTMVADRYVHSIGGVRVSTGEGEQVVTSPPPWVQAGSQRVAMHLCRVGYELSQTVNLGLYDLAWLDFGRFGVDAGPAPVAAMVARRSLAIGPASLLARQHGCTMLAWPGFKWTGDAARPAWRPCGSEQRSRIAIGPNAARAIVMPASQCGSLTAPCDPHHDTAPSWWVIVCDRIVATLSSTQRTTHVGRSIAMRIAEQAMEQMAARDATDPPPARRTTLQSEVSSARVQEEKIPPR